MFCEKCGSEVADGSRFCKYCGSRINPSANASNRAFNVKKDKNMITALIISFILPGMGIFYAGNKKKGIVLFIAGLIFAFMGIRAPISAVIGILIWAYGLYGTYNEVRIANGEANPNLIEDIKGFPTNKKIASIVVIAVILLVVIGGIAGALAPKQTAPAEHLDDNQDFNVTPSSTGGSNDYSSSGSDSYSSSGSDGSGSYSASSNGHDVSSHYEGEYGSSDTHGTVYDDGSVESHQKGHTDYGDYEIDSYMDSNGNIHGDVEVGGQSYHVSS